MLLTISMHYFKNSLKNNLFLIIAISLAAALRFIWLDRVPPAIGGDELTYIITTKYMALSWSDIVGNWNPFSIFIFHYPQQFQAEISYFLLLPFIKFLPLSIFSVKFIFALLSTASVFLMYPVTKILFGKKTAVIASFIAAINPWSVFIGRTAYEMVPETFFALLSLYILLKVKGWKILWSIPILAALFYSHIAIKIIFLPLVLLILFYVFMLNKKKYLKQYVIVGLFSLLLTLFFAFSIKTNVNFPRSSEVISLNDQAIIKTVNQTRKTTIDNPLSSMFDNKVIVFSNILIAKFFKTISFDYLFLNGDQFYSIYNHGLFYIVDALFVALGFIYAFIRKRGVFYFLSILAVLGITPHILHTAALDNFTPQISLLFPVFIMLIAFGIKNISEVRRGKMLLIMIAVVYTVSLLNFLNIYFYQFPLKETFDFKIRVLSSYILRDESNNKITVYSAHSEEYFKKYIFYTNSINSDTADKISEAVKNRNYLLANVKFTDCNTPNFTNNTVIIDSNCSRFEKKGAHISISRLSDAGSTFEIYNDTVCKKFALNYYATGVRLSDFSIEKLSTNRFCSIYITK